jgi:hypothetical protein
MDPLDVMPWTGVPSGSFSAKLLRTSSMSLATVADTKAIEGLAPSISLVAWLTASNAATRVEPLKLTPDPALVACREDRDPPLGAVPGTNARDDGTARAPSTSGREMFTIV